MKFFKKYSKWVAAFIFAVAVITVYKTFDNLSDIVNVIGVVISAIEPFLVGFIIAYILNLPAKKLNSLIQKSKFKYLNTHSGGISILLTYLIFFGLVLWVICALVPTISKNIIELYNNLPTYIDTVMANINNLDIVQKLTHGNPIGGDFDDAISDMFKQVDFSQVGKYAQGVFNITSSVVSIFIAIVASVYMLIDKKRISASIMNFISIIFGQEKAERIKNYALSVNLVFTNFIYSRLVCCIVMAVVSSVVLSLMKVKYAIILGLFIGVMDMIPYFGSIIASALTVVVTLITGGLFKAAYTAVVIIILQQLDGNILGPKIMGDTLEIRPLWIVFAVSVGGTLFGFMGMLLAVPVFAILRSLISDILDDIKPNTER